MSILDIQEFYEVTLLDNQRWPESSKVADSTTPVNLWELSSLQSTLTSDTPPSFSTSIEVRPPVHPGRHVLHRCLNKAKKPSQQKLYFVTVAILVSLQAHHPITL